MRSSNILCFLISSIFLITSCTHDPASIHDKKVHVDVYVDGNGKINGIGSDTIMSIGDTLELSAVPDSGFIFAGWRYDKLEMGNPLRMELKKDISITACFVKKPENLVFIPAFDSIFDMGSNDKYSKDYEKPVHKVKFRHDFFIGSHEVTNGEYRTVMGDASLPSGATGLGDSLPISNVTWYDAVLFCNALSKLHGYDTVYSYKSKCPSNADCSFILEDLKTRFCVYGYRLPTEAEWEYACRGRTKSVYFWSEGNNENSSADKFSWYYANSGGRSHPVCGKMPNHFGLFDMCGNVSEWVNDWLDSYPDSMIIDPVGAVSLSSEQYESSWERPVRGGSWRLGVDFMRSASRVGPYSTSAFVKLNDIGFRIAVGAFQGSEFIHDSTSKDSLDVILTCSKSDLISFIGTNKIKIAFVVANGNQSRNLYYFDFDKPTTIGLRCGNDNDVNAPVISPDGRFVAYSAKAEGFTGPCSLTVRPLDESKNSNVKFNGFLPRWWVAPDAADTFLIYTDGASMNNQAKWYSEKTYKRRMSGGLVSGAQQVLWELGSYHGGLSSDGRFLGTAYPTAKVVDMQINDTNLFYFTPPYNGRIDTPQICNFSMSPSKSDPGEAMFVDFGYNGVSTLLGKPYDFHSVIFVCNTKLLSYSHVVKWFERPLPYSQWDYVEWSNHPDFAIALARSSDLQSNAIYFINCKDSSYLKIAEGSKIRDLWLWIDPSKVSEKDDPYKYFGEYDIPIQSNSQIVLSKKMHLFWRFRSSMECAVLGNSPTFYGFDPSKISLHTINLAAVASELITSTTLGRYYVVPLSPKLKAIVLDLDAGFLSTDYRYSPPRLTGLYDSKGYGLDTSCNFYRSGIPQEILEKAASFDSSTWSGLDTNGYSINNPIGNGWGMPVIDHGDYDINDSIVQYSISCIKALADSAALHKVQLLVVNYPQNPGYKQTEMAGRYGPSHNTFDKLVEILKNIEQNNPYFHFYDANNYGNHDYTDDEAMDTNHLNYRGGAKIAERVDSILTSLLNK